MSERRAGEEAVSDDDRDYDGSDYDDDESYESEGRDVAPPSVYEQVQAWLVSKGVSYNGAKAGTEWFLEKWTCNFSTDDLLMYMTLFVLFGDNIKLLAAPKELDAGFEIANSICMFFFIVEFLANTWVKTQIESWSPFRFKGYLFTFFWYLDIISIVSMWFDISWIANPMGMGNIANQVGGQNANLTKAGRVARLVRLVRLVRLYKIAMDKRQKMREDREIRKLIERGDVTYEDVQKQRMLNQKRESKLGEKLSSIITQKVIILVLVMVIIIPLLQPNTDNYAPWFGTKVLQSVNKDIFDQAKYGTAATLTSTVRTALVKQFLNEFQYDEASYAASEPDVIYLYMSAVSSTPIIDKSARLKYLRESASVDVYYPTECESGCNPNVKPYVYAVFDYNPTLRESAMYSIIITIFIGIMLVVGSVTFNEDSQKLVLTPIERMMNMVEAVARDPMQELHFDEKKDETDSYETLLLESTIEKITSLLRVGFGEAGAGIISANLSNSTGGSAAVDPLLPGIRVYVIVGFCDIHHFEEILVKLNDGILTFVNTVASVVHEAVVHWDGQCNKNLGQAFVILWRISDEQSLLNLVKTSSFRKKSVSGAGTDGDAGAVQKKQLVDLRRVPGIDTLADHALIGYLKIIAEINRNKGLLAYRNEPRLAPGNGEEFKVRMGFGLHAGWAIEGAVGSIFKVDATYLSPHVNMAARLETSSKQYGVPLLASHFVHELLSETAQSKCRRLDIVTVKGSEVPINIFTYDCLQDQTFKRVLAPASHTAVGLDDKVDAITGELARRVNLQDVVPVDIDDLPGAFSYYTPKPYEPQADGAVAGYGALLPGVSEGTETDSPHKDTAGAGADSPTGTASGAAATGSAAQQQAADAPVGIFMYNTDDTADVFEKDDDLVMLRSHVTEEFTNTFREGVDAYLEGKWPAARERLELANAMMALLVPSMGGDGPCQTLLEYMGERDWTAPGDWEGYRPLTSK